MLEQSSTTLQKISEAGMEEFRKSKDSHLTEEQQAVYNTPELNTRIQCSRAFGGGG